MYRIIGFGHVEDEAAIKSTITKYSLSEYVNYDGEKKLEELEKYFNEANVGISFVPITKSFNNQQPTKTYEYLASGLFVIATETKANMSLITKENGILVDDTVIGFCKGLEELYSRFNSIDFNNIRLKSQCYLWFRIVNDNLVPYLNNIINDQYFQFDELV